MINTYSAADLNIFAFIFILFPCEVRQVMIYC